MADEHNSKSLNSRVSSDIGTSTSASTNTTTTTTGDNNKGNNGRRNAPYGGQKPHYPNPPDATNPDAATLREQWRFAIRQYSRWYSHAWGTAILAGISFFALGWIIKGSNPLPSRKDAGTGDRQEDSSEPFSEGQR